MAERVVWVKERCSDTDRSRGVYAGAFGARVGVEGASRTQWAGALLVVESWRKRLRVRSLVLASWSMGGRDGRTKTMTDSGRTEGAVVSLGRTGGVWRC